MNLCAKNNHKKLKTRRIESKDTQMSIQTTIRLLRCCEICGKVADVMIICAKCGIASFCSDLCKRAAAHSRICREHTGIEQALMGTIDSLMRDMEFLPIICAICYVNSRRLTKIYCSITQPGGDIKYDCVISRDIDQQNDPAGPIIASREPVAPTTWADFRSGPFILVMKYAGVTAMISLPKIHCRYYYCTFLEKYFDASRVVLPARISVKKNGCSIMLL
jgi:hypothetical protein